MKTYQKITGNLMLRNITSCLSIAASVLLLTACASPVPKIDAAPGALNGVLTIAVLIAPEPNDYKVMNFGHGGVAFGLIGGLVAAADQQNKQTKLSNKYKAEGVAINATLARELVAALNNAGFAASVEQGSWSDNKLALDKFKSDADAVLVITPEIVGFVAAGSANRNNDYQPTISAIATLVGQDRMAAPIYRGYHLTGWELRQEGWQYTAPRTTYTNFDSMFENSQGSAGVMYAAAKLIASSIARDIKSQSLVTAETRK
jgi:hypothetical protein